MSATGPSGALRGQRLPGVNCLRRQKKGEAFSLVTGEPVSWARSEQPNLSWYDFACQYVDMKWKAASAKYRQDVARALVAATPPLVVGRPPATDRSCARR